MRLAFEVEAHYHIPEQSCGDEVGNWRATGVQFGILCYFENFLLLAWYGVAGRTGAVVRDAIGSARPPSGSAMWYRYKTGH